jgi:hypothetical protein
VEDADLRYDAVTSWGVGVVAKVFISHASDDREPTYEVREAVRLGVILCPLSQLYFDELRFRFPLAMWNQLCGRVAVV